jgi:uncharacterized protein (TIGR02145 family)
MKKTIYLFICLFTYLSVSLNGQVINSQKTEKNEGIQRNATYNLEEIKVRWKKAALENCIGVPCVSVTVPGSPTIVNVVAGSAQATVSFTAPSSTGGSAITSYTVTSAPVGGTGSGTGSPITVTGLSNGTSYTFTVIATNAVGNSLPSAASNAVTPVAACSAGAASSTPTLTVNTALTNITHATTSATGIGTATGLPTGVSAAWSSNTITISGTPSATGTFNYTIPLTGTSCSSVNATGIITVTAACAAAAASSTPTLTVGTALTPNITHGTTSATGIGSASGLPTGVTAAWSANVITISGTPSTTGTFNYTIPLTGTSCSSVNATGTITVTTACGSVSSVSDYDGNAYATVSIGTQCWTKENLKVTKYNDGSAIQLNNTYTSGTVSTVWQGLTIGAYTIYANESSTSANATNYGFLYNWYAAKGIATAGSPTYKNICPIGWHVPTDTEWFTLTNYLGTTPGNAMKSTGTTYWSSQSTGTNDSSGFSALPGGRRVNDGSFSNIRTNAFFWSAAEDSSSSNNGYSRRLAHNNGDVTRLSSNKSTGASVRCLKD